MARPVYAREKQIPDSLCNNYLQMRDTENVGIETESSSSATHGMKLTSLTTENDCENIFQRKCINRTSVEGLDP